MKIYELNFKETQAMEYLRSQLQSNDKELFIVCTKGVDKDQTWLFPEYRHDGENK